MTISVAVYSPVRNETKLCEWINYNLKLGVSHIILFDDNDDKNSLQYVTSKYPDIVSIIRYDKMTNSEKIEKNYHNSNKLYRKLIKPLLRKLKIDYLLRVDADEFLFLNEFQNIQELINYYTPFDSLLINWLLFGSNNKKYNNTDTLIPIFNKSSDKLDPLVKSLTKVSSL